MNDAAVPLRIMAGQGIEILDQARLPGGIEEERLRLHRRDGIRYGAMEQEAARKVSDRLGVPLPWD